MAESIRVDRGIKRIDVNDEGGYIEVTLNDPNFFSNFAQLLKWISDKQEETEKNVEEVKETVQQGEDLENIDLEKITIFAQRHVDFCRETCERLDMLFGRDCCRKVFGEMLPDEQCIADFLDQITPIIQRMADRCV